MASLPLVGVKPCPRRWLIRAEERRRGGEEGAADSQQWEWREKGVAGTQGDERLG